MRAGNSKRAIWLGVLAVSAIAVISIAVIKTRFAKDAGLGVHGASQAITVPPIADWCSSTPTSIGWLADGRLWLLDKQSRYRVSAPPYTQFTTLGQAPPQTKFPQLGEMALSPDGKWGASTATVSNQEPLIWSVGGGGETRWQSDLGSHSWWKRDSSGVYSLATSGEQDFQLIFTPVSASNSKPNPINLTNMLDAYGDISSAACSTQVDEFPDGKLYFFTGGPDNITTWVVDPSGKSKTVKSAWMPFQTKHKSLFDDPRTCMWSESALSPDGKQLAWICHVEELSWFSSMVHNRLKIGSAPNPNVTSEVHITDLKGNHDMRVGWTPASPPGIPFGDENPISHLQWLPDGRHVSVFFKGEIYLIPVAKQ